LHLNYGRSENKGAKPNEQYISVHFFDLVDAIGGEVGMRDDFSKAFEALTGYVPLSWQTRLFSERIKENRQRGVIDIPTGLGKTVINALSIFGARQ
jgi:hypothetical protein